VKATDTWVLVIKPEPAGKDAFGNVAEPPLKVVTERMLRTFWVLESCSYRKRKERTLY
jgi:hypothetical protein